MCEADIPECRIKLFQHNEKDEILIATATELLHPACHGLRALAAVKVRFATVAGWSLRHSSRLSLSAETCDAVAGCNGIDATLPHAWPLSNPATGRSQRPFGR